MTTTLERAKSIDDVLHTLRDAVRTQMAEYMASPSGTFTLQLNDAVVIDAVRAFQRVACAAEPILDECAHLTRAFCAPATVYKLSLVTVGYCPTRAAVLPRPQAYITKVVDIGHHIPLDRFRKDWLESLDQRLSDNKPSCTYCPHGARKKQHPTVLSYMRYYPEELNPCIRDIDDVDRAVARRQYDVATARGRVHAHILSARHEDAQREQRRAQQALFDAAQLLGGKILLVTTRVKGDGRLAWKLIRDERVNDRFGLKVVAATRDYEETRRIAEDLATIFRARIGDDGVSDVVRKPQGNWDGFKFTAAYASRGLLLPISIQVQPDDAYWADYSDHPFYEERQLSVLERKRAEGWPIDAAYRELTRILRQAAQS